MRTYRINILTTGRERYLIDADSASDALDMWYSKEHHPYHQNVIDFIIESVEKVNND